MPFNEGQSEDLRSLHSFSLSLSLFTMPCKWANHKFIATIRRRLGIYCGGRECICICFQIMGSPHSIEHAYFHLLVVVLENHSSACAQCPYSQTTSRPTRIGLQQLSLSAACEGSSGCMRGKGRRRPKCTLRDCIYGAPKNRGIDLTMSFVHKTVSYMPVCVGYVLAAACSRELRSRAQQQQQATAAAATTTLLSE